MSGRHQPLNGADSAEGLVLSGYVNPDGSGDGNWSHSAEALEFYRVEERYSTTINEEGATVAVHTDVFALRPKCAACSLPAVTDGYCAGHARLEEYRVTDETHWAANE